MSRTILVADDDQDIIDLVEFNLSRKVFLSWRRQRLESPETAKRNGPMSWSWIG